jgi:protein subunit release factor A
MKERLNLMIERYNYLNEEMLKPEIYNEYNKMKVISKEKNSLEETVNTYKKLLSVEADIEAAKEMMKDQEMRSFAKNSLPYAFISKTTLKLSGLKYSKANT